MEGVSLRLINKIKHEHKRKYLRFKCCCYCIVILLPFRLCRVAVAGVLCVSFYLFIVAVINGKQLQKKEKYIKRRPQQTAHPKVELQNEM